MPEGQGMLEWHALEWHAPDSPTLRYEYEAASLPRGGFRFDDEVSKRLSA